MHETHLTDTLAELAAGWGCSDGSSEELGQAGYSNKEATQQTALRALSSRPMCELPTP